MAKLPRCPACQEKAVIRKGRTRSGVQKYHCRNAACPQPFFRGAYYTPRPAARAGYMAAYRERQGLAALASHVRCRQIGPCLLVCSSWAEVYPLLPRQAAIVSDPPYKAGTRGYDVTKTRRKPSQPTFKGLE
jgi:hypothetical protein